MAITTVTATNSVFPSFRPALVAVSVAAVFCFPTALNADSSFSPAVELTSHGYQLKLPPSMETDKGAALEVVPSLAWRYQGPRMQSRVDLNHQRVWYKDSQRSPYSLNEFTAQNSLSGFDRRVVWTLNASQSHQIRGGGEGAGLFRDRITALGSLSRTNRYGTNVLLSNAPHKEAQFALDLSANKFESKRPAEDDSFGSIDNEQFRANFSTSKVHQYGGVFWRGGGSVARTNRAERARLVRDNAQLQLGVPLLPGLAWMVKGYYEQNSIQNSDFTNEFSSAGTGLEWQFGRVSRVNLTYNTVLSDSDQSNFVAADFLLAPSRRTSLSGSWDKRYFGRTAQVAGDYRLRFLTMRLSYSDNLTTRSFLETELLDLGIFVCPDGAADIGDCTTFPGPGYQLGVNEQLQQFFDIDLNIRDDVILNRQGAFALGYNRNRLTSSLQLSSSELRYVEQNRVDRRHNASLQTSWRLTPLSRLRANVRAYQYNFGVNEREDKSWQYELGWSRDLSSVSDINVTARHSRRDSNITEFDYRENRVSLSYSYRF